MAEPSVGREALYQPPPGPLNLAVLLGGPSAERRVSLASGRAACAALASRGHRVTPIDPARVDLAAFDFQGFACAFIALHGAFGEDGQVQDLLERRGVPYTGSGPAASRLAMDKLRAKEVFLQRDIPTPAFVPFAADDAPADLRAKADQIGFPLVVKPRANGSSLGISLVRQPRQLAAALRKCFRYESQGLLEQYIAGRELTVGILNDRPLPIIELCTGREFYDYTAKYVSRDTRYLFDLNLPEAEYAAIQFVAARAHASLGCRCMSRVDIMLDPLRGPYVLEVNTIPGMTSHSLLPKAASRAGLDFADLCETMVQYALRTERVAA